MLYYFGFVPPISDEAIPFALSVIFGGYLIAFVLYLLDGPLSKTHV